MMPLAMELLTCLVSLSHYSIFKIDFQANKSLTHLIKRITKMVIKKQISEILCVAEEHILMGDTCIRRFPFRQILI